VHDYDVVVIGGGHNGLVAAAYLAKAGPAHRRLRAPARRGRRGGERAPVRARLHGHVAVLRRQPAAAPLVRDLDLERHGYAVYPQGPYFAPRVDGRYLQLPGPDRAAAEQIAKFSDKDADAIERWDAWFDDLAAVLGPLLDDRRAAAGLAPAGGRRRAARACCASCGASTPGGPSR
jgi:phytoene dehydrogenase-like protein